MNLLFKDFPIELRAALQAPKGISKHLNFRAFEIDIRAGSYKMIELDECISFLGLYYPEFKQSFSSHLRFLSSCRNAAVHSFLPSYRAYELDRTAYLGLNLFDHFRIKKVFKHLFFTPSDPDKKFLKEFDSERIIRVQKAVEEARSKAKKTPHQSCMSVDDWHVYVVNCPVCENDAILSGYTDISYSRDEGGSQYLTFFADSFECEECGLSLSDTEELRLAGLETVHDRDSELERYLHEKHGQQEV